MANTPAFGGLPTANTLSPVLVDGMPIDALTSALATGAARTPGGRKTNKNRFWSSPRRPILDPTVDVFEVRLNQDHRVNAMSFEISNFPFRCEVEEYDSKARVWAPVFTESGSPTVLTNDYSHPARVVTKVVSQSTNHPFHHGTGHWLKFNLKTQTFKSSRFRLKFTRPFGTPPTDRNQTPLAYPLGVRKFHVSYHIRDKKHVPVQPKHPHYPKWQQPIDSTSDLLGSGRTYSMRENLASDLLTGGIWKSEPQPVANAIVNFYADIRDAQGNPSVTDRFFMDPLFSGTSVNVYYSNDDLPTTFAAENLPQGVLEGDATPDPIGMTLQFPNDGSFVDVDNQGVHFDPSQTWWMGIRFAPQYDSTDPATYSIFDFVDANLSITAGVITLALNTATVDVPLTFNANTVLNLIISWDGSETLSLVDADGVFETATVDITGNPFPDGPPDFLRFFGSQTDATVTGNLDLYDLMLKYGAPTDADIAAFGGDQTDLDAYLNPPEFTTTGPQPTDNALLRFTFQQIVAIANPTGFIGGTGNVYSGLIWTPINRDFTAAKGNFDFPAITAKFLNLEFSSLSPQPYETFKPIYRTVQLSQVTISTNGQTYTQEPGGATVNGEIAPTAAFVYGDVTGVGVPSLPVPANGYTRTEAQYTSDPTVYPVLRKIDPVYGLMPWQPSTGSPSFAYVTTHSYITTTMKQTTRVGFFCGLSQFTVYRVNFLSNDDTRQYLDLYQDLANIASTDNWQIALGDISTPPQGDFGATGHATMVSEVFSSSRKVIGLQFATTQSPPTQLLPDADFNTFNADGTQNLAAWEIVGDTTMMPSDIYNTDIGTTVQVQRTTPGVVYFGGARPTPASIAASASGTTIYDPLNFTWGGVQTRFPTWADIESQTWGELEGIDITVPVILDPTTGLPALYVPGQTIGTPRLGGIQSAITVQPSLTGRIYAAARVIAPKALQAPLWVQIVSTELDTDGNAVVLAEVPYNIPAGTVCEFYVGYTAHTGDVDSSGEVRVRLVQKYQTGDEWFVDNLSIFEDSITWEFSNDGGANFYAVFDIRNDPNGVFIFPPSTDPDAPQSVGRSLVYRASGYRPDLHINSIAIRPWYDTYNGATPPRELIHTTGAQKADYDNYPPIQMDPHWRMWSKPVPIEWWFFYRQWLLLTSDTIVLPPVATIFLNDNLIVPTNIPVVFLNDNLIVPLEDLVYVLGDAFLLSF